MRKRKIIIGSIVIIAAIIALISVCDVSVARNASGKTYDDVDDLPHRKVGLILGTSPISTWNGRRNYYFDHRIKAGADLYKAGKVDWLVVSGGDYRNTENGYDEPVAMRDSLMKQGVDSTRIILDYDGTRTLNSIAKMRDVYCQDSITIISQKYHNERALYQAKHLGIDAIAFNAKTPGRRTSWWRNRGREVLARVKLFIDLIPSNNFCLENRYNDWHRDLVEVSDSITAVLFTSEKDEWPHNVKVIYKVGEEFWYYNIVHQFGLMIPKEMAFCQEGELGFDNSGNTFYLNDEKEYPSLIISCYSVPIYNVEEKEWYDEYISSNKKYYSYSRIFPYISAKDKESILKITICWTDATKEFAHNYILSLNDYYNVRFFDSSIISE